MTLASDPVTPVRLESLGRRRPNTEANSSASSGGQTREISEHCRVLVYSYCNRYFRMQVLDASEPVSFVICAQESERRRVWTASRQLARFSRGCRQAPERAVATEQNKARVDQSAVRALISVE